MESGEYCYVAYRANSSSSWTTINIIGDIDSMYDTELDYEIILPDSDLYNDDSFEIGIGNNIKHSGMDDCWFRMLEIYGIPVGNNPDIHPATHPTPIPTNLRTVHQPPLQHQCQQ